MTDEFYLQALDCLKEIQITLQNELEEIGCNLERIADSIGKQCTTLDRIEQGLSHDVCMGIRKGLFGIDAKDNETIMQAVWEFGSLVEKIGHIEEDLQEICVTWRPRKPTGEEPPESQLQP